MKEVNRKFSQLIFDLMNGSLNLKDFPVKESQIVANEFENGRYCEILYGEAYEARERLYKRLKNEEDKDVEFIIGNFSDMTHRLCINMFECGYAGSEKSVMQQDCYDLFTHVWITKACSRICKRLGKETDEDVSIIIANHSNIMHYLGMKMYNYGIYFSKLS